MNFFSFWPHIWIKHYQKLLYRLKFIKIEQTVNKILIKGWNPKWGYNPKWIIQSAHKKVKIMRVLVFKHCTGEYPVIKGQSIIMISLQCRRCSESRRVEFSWASQSFSFHLQIKWSRSWFQFYGRRFPRVSNVTCLKLSDQTFNLNRSIRLIAWPMYINIFPFPPLTSPTSWLSHFRLSRSSPLSFLLLYPRSFSILLHFPYSLPPLYSGRRFLSAGPSHPVFPFTTFPQLWH